MSFPKITNKQYRKCTATRLGSQFMKRLGRGVLIDRKTTTDPQNVKTVKAPNALAKFFNPITYKEAL